LKYSISKNVVTLKSGQRSVKVIGTDTDRSDGYDLLLTLHSNHGLHSTVSEIDGDFSRKLQNFPTSRVFCPADGVPLGIGTGVRKKTE